MYGCSLRLSYNAHDNEVYYNKTRYTIAIELLIRHLSIEKQQKPML